MQSDLNLMMMTTTTMIDRVNTMTLRQNDLVVKKDIYNSLNETIFCVHESIEYISREK